MTTTNNEKHHVSVLMRKIDKFVQSYGVDKLIEYLGDYQKDIDLDEFYKYQRIQKSACDVYELPIADLSLKKLGSKNKSVRMIIAYLTRNYTKLNRQQIALMMKANLRTIGNYITETKYRIQHELMYPVFCENFNIIKEKSKIE